MTADVFVIVLNYNNAKDTIECVRSLRATEQTDYSIVIVDNGSEPEIIDQVQRACQDVTMIRNQRNLGFAAGMNVGIRYALEQGAKWLFVLNNDTVVERACIPELVAHGTMTDAGIIVPKIRFYSRPKVLWYAGSRRGLLFNQHRGLGENDSGQYDKVQQVEFATGCAMLLRAEMVRNIGLYDEVFFFGMEDREYSDRCRRAGFRILFVPSAVLYHKVSASRGALTPRNVYMGYRAQFLYLMQSKQAWPLWHLLYAFYIIIVLPIRLRLRKAEGVQKLVGMAFRALTDSIAERRRTT